MIYSLMMLYQCSQLVQYIPESPQRFLHIAAPAKSAVVDVVLVVFCPGRKAGVVYF